MSAGSGIRHLSQAGKPPALDERLLLDEEPAPPALAEPRFTRFTPAPRGPMEPVAGSVGDGAAMRALATSGAGWLHEDGRIVSKGTADGLKALRIVPEMVPLLDRLDQEVAAVKAVREAQYEEVRTDHIARGQTEEEFSDEDADQDYATQIADEHPGPDVAAELARAGWIALDLRRDRGEKTIRVPDKRVETDGHECHLRDLAGHMDARVVATFRPKSKPDPYAGLQMTPEQRANLVEYVLTNGRYPEDIVAHLAAAAEEEDHKPGF